MALISPFTGRTVAAYEAEVDKGYDSTLKTFGADEVRKLSDDDLGQRLAARLRLEAPLVMGDTPKLVTQAEYVQVYVKFKGSHTILEMTPQTVDATFPNIQVERDQFHFQYRRGEDPADDLRKFQADIGNIKRHVERLNEELRQADERILVKARQAVKAMRDKGDALTQYKKVMKEGGFDVS